MSLTHVPTGLTLAEEVTWARSFWSRARGLIGRSLLPGGALVIEPAKQVHTFFMRFPIDAVFLDRDLRILEVVPDLKPWRMAAKRGAKQVLEIAAGEAERRGLAPGGRLVLGEEEGDQAAEG